MTWATRDRAEAAEARVKELEAEVKRLKRALAAKFSKDESDRLAKQAGGDWLAHLPKQDRAYMEKKLGKTK